MSRRLANLNASTECQPPCLADPCLMYAGFTLRGWGTFHHDSSQIEGGLGFKAQIEALSP